MSSIVIKDGLLVVDAEGKDKIFPVQGNVMFDFFGKAKASSFAVAGDVELSIQVANEIIASNGESKYWWMPNKTVDKIAKYVLSKLMGREDVCIAFYGDNGMYVIDGGFGYFPGDTELQAGIVLGKGSERSETLTIFDTEDAHQILVQILREESCSSGFYPAQCIRYS